MEEGKGEVSYCTVAESGCLDHLFRQPATALAAVLRVRRLAHVQEGEALWRAATRCCEGCALPFPRSWSASPSQPQRDSGPH